MPSVAYVAQFKRHYPGEYWSPRYRTRDHVIPFGVFWVLFREIPVNAALERVSEMRAVLNAIGMAFRKDSALPDSVREDLRTARLEGHR